MILPYNRQRIVNTRMLPFLMATVLFSCTAHLVNRNSSSAVQIQYQKVFLKPIEGISCITESRFWPDTLCEKAMVSDNMNQLWKNLLSEFRRCEKYGLYTMVDSMESYSVEVSVKLISAVLQGDTLSIPLNVTIENKVFSQNNTYQIPAHGICYPYTDTMPACYRIGSGISDYKRCFPYQEIVSKIYQLATDK